MRNGCIGAVGGFLALGIIGLWSASKLGWIETPDRWNEYFALLALAGLFAMASDHNHEGNS